MKARFRYGLGAAALLVALAGCSDSDEIGGLPRLPMITVTPQEAAVVVNGTMPLKANLQNAQGTVLWRTSNPQVAVVDGAGVLRGVGPGEAWITALLAQDTTVRATVRVLVTGPPSTPPPAPDTLRVLGLGAVAERYTGEVAVRGDWAYTSTWSFRTAPGNAIKVWNVAGNTPVLVDSLIIDGVSTTGDVQISADGALLVAATEYNPGSIVIFDRSNPARPVQLARFRNPNTAPGVHTVKLDRVNGRHYAFLSVNPGSGVPARLVIVDITDPAAPQEVLARTMGRPYVHDVFVRDGLLFAALWDDGMTIFDIGGGGRGGSPASPVQISNVIPAPSTRPSGCPTCIHNIWWFRDPSSGAKRYVFLGEEGPGSVGGGSSSGDVHVIDISDIDNPHEVALYGVPGAGTHNFWMDEARGIFYAAYYNGGVRALDVRGDLGTCTSAQKTSNGLCDLRLMGREKAVALTTGSFIWGVMGEGSYLYASDMRMGLFKLEAAR